MGDEYKCELCDRKADYFGHIQFLERDHVWFFCKECLDKAVRGEYGRLAALTIYEELD